MDYSTPIKTWCGCPDCTRLRKWNDDTERPRTYSTPIASPFSQALSDLADTLNKIPAIPFEPEPQAEPVYSHVLVDFDTDDSPLWSMAELHDAESLLEAIAGRHDQEGRYKVYKLGALILDVVEVE